ncbi:MAG: hypothetical protein LBU92_01560 [Prevotellaceae bacterium]|jgi:hypothetical protein|nr:hypothetical protein [Prevotellaceae bacterium]
MKKVFLTIFLLAAALLSAQAAGKPKSLVLITDQIAMGITDSDFLDLLSETVTVTAMKDADFTRLFRYQYVRRWLRHSVRYNESTKQYLGHPDHTKMYVIENPTRLWPRRRLVAFYFYREDSGQPFTLFAINAVHKVDEADMNTIYKKRLPGAKANRPGKTPLELTTAFHPTNGGETTALMAVWSIDGKRDILLVPDNGPLISSEFIFVCERGFKNWAGISSTHM